MESVSSVSADLLLTTTRVHLVECHARPVIGQFPKPKRLLSFVSGYGWRAFLIEGSLISGAVSSQVRPISSIHSEAARFNTLPTTAKLVYRVVVLAPCAIEREVVNKKAGSLSRECVYGITSRAARSDRLNRGTCSTALHRTPLQRYDVQHFKGMTLGASDKRV